jgi:hypothetical protein
VNDLPILDEIHDERVHQDEKWHEQNHPDGTGNRWFEFERDFYRDLCERMTAEGKITWRHILLEEVYEALAEEDPAHLRSELVQVAAVATAWIEAIDRRRALPDREAEENS